MILRFSRWLRLPAILAGAALPTFAAGFFIQQNLVSDVPGAATFLDPDLVNPWGLASSGASPWWVSDNASGLATLYSGTGIKQGIVVTIPPPTGGTPPAAPTGVVFNSTTNDFKVAGTKANFIFATEDGTISAWAGGANAALEVDNSGSGAVYKGLAAGNNGTANYLYATNFRAGTVDVFDGTFAPVTLSGSFTDPGLPSGYAPFDIQNIGGALYVTYALQNTAKHDDVAGAGHGFIDVFDTNGNLQKRLVSADVLDSPWGLALAPAGFGAFGGDLLVGNFGDGTIHAIDPLTGTTVGQLMDSNGNPISIEGLWGLAFGNGASAGPTTSLFFTAGISGGETIESHGLFGDLVASPEPSAVWLMTGGLGFGLLWKCRTRLVR